MKGRKAGGSLEPQKIHKCLLETQLVLDYSRPFWSKKSICNTNRKRKASNRTALSLAGFRSHPSVNSFYSSSSQAALVDVWQKHQKTSLWLSSFTYPTGSKHLHWKPRRTHWTPSLLIGTWQVSGSDTDSPDFLGISIKALFQKQRIERHLGEANGMLLLQQVFFFFLTPAASSRCK